MNLVYGEIVEVRPGGESGRVRVGGAIREISLGLLTNPSTGEKVLVCEGVALGKVDSEGKEVDHVPGHTR